MNATPYFKFHSRAIIFTTCAAAAAATAAADDGDDDKWQCETLTAARAAVSRARSPPSQCVYLDALGPHLKDIVQPKHALSWEERYKSNSE